MAIPVIRRPEVPPSERLLFFKHVCPPNFGGGPFDVQSPDIKIARSLLNNLDIVMPNGLKVRFWAFEDFNDPNRETATTFPGKLIRVNEGQIVQADVVCKGGTHTVHWHGIEPSALNDGVGKHSFEVDGHFFYQFQPRQAGTYFYHCHKNTALHFEMGLYGPLIVDPPGTDPTKFPRRAFTEGPLYDVEAIWAVDEIDSKWHVLGHNAFVQACDKDDPVNPRLFAQDGFLHDFRPDFFTISGVFKSRGDGTPINDPRVSVKGNVGQTILIRLIAAGYTIQEYTFPLPLKVIAQDGHPLGSTAFSQYSFPFDVTANQPFYFTSARRWDLLIKAEKTGVFPVTIRFLDWGTGKLLSTLITNITIK